MEELSSREENFCVLYRYWKDAAYAYSVAFNVEGMKAEEIKHEAALLMKKPRIKARIFPQSGKSPMRKKKTRIQIKQLWKRIKGKDN